MLRRTKVPQAGVRLGSKSFSKCRRQSRLADPRFAGEQHHLTFPGFCLPPAAQQQIKFFFSSHKLR
jgi:hypothetical protein